MHFTDTMSTSFRRICVAAVPCCFCLLLHALLLHCLPSGIPGQQSFYNMADSYYNRAGGTTGKPQAPPPSSMPQQQQQQQQPPQQQQQRPPPSARVPQAAASSTRQQQQQRREPEWTTNQQQQQKKSKPRPASAPVYTAPAAPAEVVVLNEGVAAFTAEQVRVDWLL
jgi:hypothetical protein